MTDPNQHENGDYTCAFQAGVACSMRPALRGSMMTAMLTACVLATPAAQEPAAGKATPTHVSPRNASYSIDADLDPSKRTLTGREVITWRNISPVATDDLRLHLYYNAWRNTQSTFLRETLLGG